MSVYSLHPEMQRKPHHCPAEVNVAVPTSCDAHVELQMREHGDPFVNDTESFDVVQERCAPKPKGERHRAWAHEHFSQQVRLLGVAVVLNLIKNQSGNM